MTLADWLFLWLHFLSLSLLAVGGAISLAPDMHRVLVLQRGWLEPEQFTASIALAQAAPGPNLLFLALFGWHLGMNQGSYLAALAGVVVALSGMLLPSSALTLWAGRVAHRRRDLRWMRAFRQGVSPVAVALILSTAWVLATAHGDPARDWRLWIVAALVAVLVWRTRLHILWLLGAGGVLGALGLI